MNKYITEKYIQVVFKQSKHILFISISLIVTETQIKTTLRYYFLSLMLV